MMCHQCGRRSDPTTGGRGWYAATETVNYCPTCKPRTIHDVEQASELRKVYSALHQMRFDLGATSDPEAVRCGARLDYELTHIKSLIPGRF